MSFNLARYVLTRAAPDPGTAALVVLGEAAETWSYGALTRAVRGIATGLTGLGVAPGDRVLLRLGNRPHFPLAYLAAIAMGAIPVPTSAQWTAPETDAACDAIRPRLVLGDGSCPMPDRDVATASADDLRAMQDLPPAPWHMGDPERPGYIVFTSGTSGRTRAVVHAHRAILARRMMWDDWYGLRPGDRLMHAGAFNWTYTLGTGLLDPWSMGATALIPAPGTDPADLPALMAAERATIFAAAPGVYRRLLRAAVPPLPDLRHGLSAGEKLPDATRRSWETATGTPIHEAYGMSECSTFISGSPDRPAPPGTLGFPQTGRRVMLRDDGQIAVHRDDPGMMLGYLDAPEETAARFDGDWFLTGDTGAATPEGAIVYTGRADDMMNAGGTRVSPIEVEEVLSHHPAVAEVACAEVRVAQDLSLIAAFYVPREAADEADLAAFASARLAAYKVPRIFAPVDALPRGANNKLLRRVLRQRWEADHGQA